MKKNKEPEIIPLAQKFYSFLTHYCGVTKITPGNINGDPKSNKKKRISLLFVGNGNFEIEFRNKREQTCTIATNLGEKELTKKIQGFCHENNFLFFEKK